MFVVTFYDRHRDDSDNNHNIDVWSQIELSSEAEEDSEKGGNALHSIDQVKLLPLSLK